MPRFLRPLIGGRRCRLDLGCRHAVRIAFVWFSGFRALATSPTDIEHDLVVIPGIIKRRDIDLSPPVGEWPLFAHSGRQVSTYRQTSHQGAAGTQPPGPAVTPVVDKRALLPPSARLPRGTGGWVVLLCRSLNISCIRPICERDTPFDKLTIISEGTHFRGPRR